MIQLITLDLDNTLWDVYPVLRQAEGVYQDWLRRQHPDLLPYYRLSDAQAARAALLEADPQLKGFPTRLRKQVMRHLFEEALHSDPQRLHEVVEDGFVVFHEARNTIDLFPETEGVLRQLSALCPLIAISNGNADVHKVGIGTFFRHQFSAESSQAPKPDPRMFRQALQQAGVQPQHCVHIGDHPEEDVSAAQALGIRGVWFNPKGEDWPLTRSVPDHEVRSLEELPGLVSSLRKT